jgi:hypothetical protein
MLQWGAHTARMSPQQTHHARRATLVHRHNAHPASLLHTSTSNTVGTRRCRRTLSARASCDSGAHVCRAQNWRRCNVHTRPTTPMRPDQQQRPLINTCTHTQPRTAYRVPRTAYRAATNSAHAPTCGGRRWAEKRSTPRIGWSTATHARAHPAAQQRTRAHTHADARALAARPPLGGASHTQAPAHPPAAPRTTGRVAQQQQRAASKQR